MYDMLWDAKITQASSIGDIPVILICVSLYCGLKIAEPLNFKPGNVGEVKVSRAL